MTCMNQKRATRPVALCAGVTFLLAGCGEGGGDDSGGENIVPCNAITALASVGLACIFRVVDTSTPPPEPAPGPEPEPPILPSDPAGSPLITRPAYDVEPNNEIAMANPVTFPTPLSVSQSVGFHVDGTYSNLSDGVDTFAMVANRARTFLFQLCASSAAEDCNQVSPSGRLNIDTAYLNVYDQAGTLLLTSEANTIDGNLLRLSVDAGVLYYVMVVAQNTGNSVQSYYLRVYESTTET